jgi:hypothetical protein
MMKARLLLKRALRLILKVKLSRRVRLNLKNLKILLNYQLKLLNLKLSLRSTNLKKRKNNLNYYLNGVHKMMEIRKMYHTIKMSYLLILKRKLKLPTNMQQVFGLDGKEPTLNYFHFKALCIQSSE